MNKCLLALAPIFLFLNGAVGQTQEKGIAMSGYGGKPCGEFIEAAQIVPLGKVRGMKDDSGTMYVTAHSLFIEWARGFITGNNWADLNNQYQKDTKSALDLWLRNYCTTNPTTDFSYAVIAFLKSEKYH